MEKKEISRYLSELSDELGMMGVKGEICLYGGAVMCLVYDARPSTKDVDAVFQPPSQMREAVKRVAAAHDLRDDWLNDAVKGFVVPHAQKILLDLPSLKVFMPEPDYLLAMKALAARVDGTDKEDILFLIKHMKLRSSQDVLSIVEKYYPRNRIRPATQFFIEELFQK
jgi:hypothetical protein